MPNANTYIHIGQLDPSLLNVEYHINIVAPVNGTYDVALEAGEDSLISTIALKTFSGTATVQVRINNTPVVYAAAADTIAVTSTKSVTPAVSSKQIPKFGFVQVVVSGISSPVNLAGTIHAMRNA